MFHYQFVTSSVCVQKNQRNFVKMKMIVDNLNLIRKKEYETQELQLLLLQTIETN